MGKVIVLNMTYQHFSNYLFLILTERDSLKNKLNAFFRFIILMIFITACAKKDSETKKDNTSQQESVKFVVVGGSGTILTSLDGNSWSSKNSGTSNLLSDVLYTNGTLISIGGVFVDNVSTVLKSTNGKTWNPITTGTSKILYDVAYGMNKYVSSGSYGAIITSSDLSLIHI